MASRSQQLFDKDHEARFLWEGGQSAMAAAGLAEPVVDWGEQSCFLTLDTERPGPAGPSSILRASTEWAPTSTGLSARWQTYRAQHPYQIVTGGLTVGLAGGLVLTRWAQTRLRRR